jgi:putative ABC transport system permease protein
MFLRLLYESFRRQTRRKMLVAVAVTLGAAVSTAMIGIALGIGDKVSQELRAYGANLVVTPEDDDLDVQIGSVNLKPAGSGAYLDEAALPKIKGIFWRNNITAFDPTPALQALSSSFNISVWTLIPLLVVILSRVQALFHTLGYPEAG